MTHDTAREHTVRFVEGCERQLQTLIGIYADARGVRAALEQLAIKCFESGARRHERMPEGERADSKDVTPLHSPRVVLEVNATRPVRPPRRRGL